MRPGMTVSDTRYRMPRQGNTTRPATRDAAERKKPAAGWLAIHFPHLALDLFTRGKALPGDQPIALSDGHSRMPCVIDCNPAASRRGIQAGMPVLSALGLAEDLHLAEPDPEAEQAALERLAAWSYQYSSQVSVHPGRKALLLESAASERLFGAPAAMAERLSSELLRLGYHNRVGTAPTTRAAHLAAVAGLHFDAHSPLSAQLSKLPIKLLEIEASRRKGLEDMGFRTIGEVLKLPRKALARRIGVRAIDDLDRLTGNRPDPQKAWRPAPRFAAGIDFPDPVAHSQGLLFPVRRLVEELCGILRASDRGIQEVHCDLFQERGTESLRLGLQRPCREAGHLMLLLRERLERLRLARPVRRIRLRAGPFLPFEAGQVPMFQDGPDSAQAFEPLLERLQARLGARAVRSIGGVQDHRPEYSWAEYAPGERTESLPMPHRPLWLFSEPRRCRIGNYRVLAGPERIETGWWDGHDCRRDYFVVRDASGCTLWAFREYKPHPGWYVHGLFG